MIRKNLFFVLAIILGFNISGSANNIILVGDESKVTRIESKDVKGTIENENAKVDTFTVINLEGTFNIPKIRLDDTKGFFIIPSKSSLKEQLEINKNAAEAFGGSFRIIEENLNGVIFEYFSDENYSKSNGFGFIISISQNSSNFLINGMGANIIENISDLKSVKEAYLIALTFKPAE